MRFPKWLRRTIKWFFGTLLSLVLLISAALYFFHDEIVQYAIGEINKNLKARVEVSKVDITFWKTFPNLSLDFHEVFVPDALPGATRADTLLYSEMIRLKFNPIDIWNENYKVKSIEVAPGTLQLKVSEKGKVNYDIIRSGSDKQSSGFELTLKSIRIRNLRFIYANALQEQTYATDFRQLLLRGKFTDKKFSLHTEAAFFIHRVQNGKIPFVVNQPATTTVDLLVNKEEKTVALPNGIVHLAGLPFNVSVFVGDQSFRANVSAENLSLTEVANHLAVKETEHVERFKGSGTASFRLSVESQLTPEAFPLIDCAFHVKNGKLTEPSQQLLLSNIQLDGSYSTLKGKGNEELLLKTVSFKTAGGPFNGKLSIRKFQAPQYKGTANGSVNLGVLHALFHLPKIDELGGDVKVNTTFELVTLQDERGAQHIDIAEGSGSAEMKNVRLKLLQDARKFEQINGRIMLDRHQAVLENLSVLLGKSDLLLSGHFDHIDGFLQDKANLEIAVVAQSRRIDLADFNNGEAPAAKTATRDWLLPTHINGQVRLDVDKIRMNNHEFQDLHGNMTVGYRSIIIEQLFGRNAGASVSGTLAVLESQPEYFDVATALHSTDIQFGSLFREWNNFEQNVITADNISGKAEVQLDLRAPFDMKSGIVKEKIKAQIGLRVVNGNLKNVQAFKELTASLKTPKTRLVLKKQDIEALEGKLSNISFKTLENTIYIHNSTIVIPSMIIESSALDITAEGSHTFDNRIDYRFAFRLRDLKVKRDESEFGEVIDDGTGIRVYVHMYGTLDNPVIEWDGASKKEQAKENRLEAKKEAMSILKSEFGLFKKDSTVKTYQHVTQPREELRIEFGREEKTDPAEEEKKTGKFKQFLKEKTNKIKQQQEQEKKGEFVIE